MATKTVLLVDDSSTARQIMLLKLGQIEGLRVVVAKDGHEALEKHKAEPADLILSDVNMPGLDGIQLVTAVRASGDSNTPIVLITTRGEDTDIQRGLSAGATAYLTKPINGIELVDTVRRLIA